MLRLYLGEILFHRPERSGLPSGVRGAGAARFGLPSGERGIPVVGCVSHCAATGALSAIVTTAIDKPFMFVPLFYFARGFGRAWNFTTFGLVPLPPSW